MSHFALKKEFAENESILKKIGYVYGGKDFILERNYLCDGYWFLTPNFAVNWTPEPSTYGATISVCALGFVFWRRRKSRLTRSQPLGGGDAQAI